MAGSGEQRLLRIAARYGDLINLSFPSGDSLDTIAHKRAVLAAHCATVGRDPAQIRVSYKAMLSIADSADRARRKWDEWRQTRGIGIMTSREGVFVGEPGQIAEQLRPWLAASIDHIVFELPDADDPYTVALAGQTLDELASPTGAVL